MAASELSVQTAAPEAATASPSDFEALLVRDFKPKSERARESVALAVKTLAEQALAQTNLVSDDAIQSISAMIKGIDAIGVRIGGLNEANPDLAIANMKALAALAADGKLRPRISHTFPLSKAAEALQAVIDRVVIGKAVLLS